MSCLQHPNVAAGTGGYAWCLQSTASAKSSWKCLLTGRTRWAGRDDARCHRNGMLRSAAATPEKRLCVKSRPPTREMWKLDLFLLIWKSPCLDKGLTLCHQYGICKADSTKDFFISEMTPIILWVTGQQLKWEVFFHYICSPCVFFFFQHQLTQPVSASAPPLASASYTFHKPIHFFRLQEVHIKSNWLFLFT